MCHTQKTFRHIYFRDSFVLNSKGISFKIFNLYSKLSTMEDQGGSSATRVSDKRLAQTQAQVNEVVGIMRVNVEKVLERDQKLSELDNRADALQHGAAQFEQQAGKLKRKYWWQNLKMMLIIGAIGGVLLIIIIVWATSGTGNSSNSTPTEAPANASSGR